MNPKQPKTGEKKRAEYKLTRKDIKVGDEVSWYHDGGLWCGRVKKKYNGYALCHWGTGQQTPVKIKWSNIFTGELFWDEYHAKQQSNLK